MIYPYSKYTADQGCNISYMQQYLAKQKQPQILSLKTNLTCSVSAINTRVYGQDHRPYINITNARKQWNMKKRIFLILISLISLPTYAAKPDIFLLKKYHQDTPVTGWVMSEKLDGIRGYWDGKNLISRGGKILSPPAWFTQNYPPFYRWRVMDSASRL